MYILICLLSGVYNTYMGEKRIKSFPAYNSIVFLESFSVGINESRLRSLPSRNVWCNSSIMETLLKVNFSGPGVVLDHIAAGIIHTV